MGTTQQHPPSGIGPGPEGSALGAATAPAASAAPTAPEGTSEMAGAAEAGSPAGERRLRRLSLGSASGIVPLARDFTRQALYDWGWLPAEGADRRAAAEDVLLVVSELVTNACLHAEGPEELRVSLDAKVLRLEVEDRGSGQPEPRTPHRAGRPGGHGMFIVQRLCLDWGVARDPGADGKTVWAELAAPA
ncbi:ATP-binding protein [Streptomyces lichenis]|uniref:ATP-binding protein n=1 Tax=Streptomyces lichenis TaxID=2306967 RepID=A0ABT0IHH3_9ACTN|nr:ATP-binding protein [Streptomyces lichenis]MCK8680730.1 ATP-binding protein [Streptomyces lichenis]